VKVDEVAVVFDCEGSDLVGVVHRPAEVRTRGLVSVVAGGPQYRGGVGRLQVQMARALAAGGTPVLRFDYRGMGDSEGEFRGFEDVAADLGAAIQAFQAQVPGMSEVVLWGGCDAAAAILINAWRFPAVTGVVVGNPWVHTEETGNAVMVKHHFRRRMLEPAFWWKVLRLQYNPLPAAAMLLKTVWQRVVSRLEPAAPMQTAEDDRPGKPFVPRMCQGLGRYQGDLLLLMSGRSIVSKEFDELVASNPRWQAALRSPRHLVRHDMPTADQTYSSVSSRDEVTAVVAAWMADPVVDLKVVAARIAA
jgi:exosortase A-associated hydrolase 1